jgi:nucleoside-diphosphate-sugar epimerase
VPELRKIKQLEIVEGDIADTRLLEKLVIGKDACILVALNYTKQTGWEVLKDDTLPTVFLSDVAAKANVKHFIYTSSTAANDSLYMAPEVKKIKQLELLQHEPNSILQHFTVPQKQQVRII